MGRATLILVVLLSTLFAGIAMRMNRHMLLLPDVLRDDQIKRETENISDYALRYAIAFAIPKITKWVKDGYVDYTIRFDGSAATNTNVTGAPLFPVGNGFIRRIEYHQIGASNNGKEIRFQAVTTTDATIQSKTVIYPAEVAFNYYKVDTPDCFYYEMNQAQLAGNADMNDTSGNNNHAYPFNGLHTFPTPGDGVAGWKCGFWHDDMNDAAYAPPHASMEVDTTFTLFCFAKLDRDLSDRDAALVWLPSVHPQSNINAAPASAIWYGGRLDGKMHYTVGLADHAPYNWLEVKFPFRDLLVANSTGNSGQGYRSYPWMFFALTFDHGVLKAYYNGLPLDPLLYHNPVVGTSEVASVSRYGVSVGSRITRVTGSGGDNYANSLFDRCMNGVLDQVGMFSRALTDEEIWEFYTATQIPTRVDYIRD